ncbi:DUF2812 domain-containing protein [Pseudoduganella sp. OTU4001]|uniref:DUF2812 domain-containing protein n=1 Tax=Pseudoduganella sp. OTU4001 TaxID=3043854 RepID=UPI00313AB96B
MKKLVWKIRWFWDDADHVIERWLEQMAREGLHLKSIHALRTIFIFERGEPAEVNYRIDFRLTRADAHYLQLFEDAGWQRVDDFLGWFVWRAPVGSVRSPEIFTDIESMGRRYKQLIWLFVVPLVLQLPLTVDQLRSGRPGAVAAVLGLHSICFYCIARLVKRLRSLSSPKG